MQAALIDELAVDSHTVHLLESRPPEECSYYEREENVVDSCGKSQQLFFSGRVIRAAHCLLPAHRLARQHVGFCKPFRCEGSGWYLSLPEKVRGLPSQTLHAVLDQLCLEFLKDPQ